MSAATVIGAGMIALVLGAARMARILERRERELLTAMEAVKRAEWAQRRTALAAPMETRVTRGHDWVPLTPDEERMFTQIADLLDPGRRVSTGACACGHSAEAHDHYRAGSDCSQCGCGRRRGRKRMTAREVIRVTEQEKGRGREQETGREQREGQS